MSNLRSLPLMVVLALLLAGPASKADEQPELSPTRDVDIHTTTRPQDPTVRERVRWLADDHLERVEPRVDRTRSSTTGRTASIKFSAKNC